MNGKKFAIKMHPDYLGCLVGHEYGMKRIAYVTMPIPKGGKHFYAIFEPGRYKNFRRITKVSIEGYEQGDEDLVIAEINTKLGEDVHILGEIRSR